MYTLEIENKYSSLEEQENNQIKVRSLDSSKWPRQSLKVNKQIRLH